jgi:hypothetical protein
MSRLTSIGAVVAACFMFTGCASIVSGQNQSLSVTTKNKGADMAGAKCSLVNDKGSWYVTTPGSVTVRRSYNDLAVNCALDGVDPGSSMVKSSTKGMAFGNILFGGVIGAGVDMSTGAAYDYPEIIIVDMGVTTKVDTSSKKDGKPAETKPADAKAAEAKPAETKTADAKSEEQKK